MAATVRASSRSDEAAQQPSRWTVISFMGRGPTPARNTDPRPAYQKTRYRFPAEPEAAAEEIESRLFGATVLRRLHTLGRPVTRWLLMGTPQSNWGDVIEALTPDQADTLTEAWEQVQRQVDAEALSQADLDRWQAALAPLLAPVEPVFRLIGAADETELEQQMWQALNEAVKPGESVCLDVTHGLRHQPIIASFMVMLLRWLRDVPEVDLYYGARDLGPPPGSLCPVLRLRICTSLLEASEAVAVLRRTGSFEPLARCLDLGPAVQEKVSEVAFANETNQQARAAARQVVAAVDSAQAGPPLQRSLAAELKTAMNWVTQEGLPARMRHKAQFAFEHGQYLNAVLLLKEAIAAAALRLARSRNRNDAQTPTEAENALPRVLSGDEWALYKRVKNVRNAVAHGTQPTDGPSQRALSSPTALKELFDEGMALLDRLLERGGMAVAG